MAPHAQMKPECQQAGQVASVSAERKFWKSPSSVYKGQLPPGTATTVLEPGPSTA